MPWKEGIWKRWCTVNLAKNTQLEGCRGSNSALLFTRAVFLNIHLKKINLCIHTWIILCSRKCPTKMNIVDYQKNVVSGLPRPIPQKITLFIEVLLYSISTILSVLYYRKSWLISQKKIHLPFWCCPAVCRVFSEDLLNNNI